VRTRRLPGVCGPAAAAESAGQDVLEILSCRGKSHEAEKDWEFASKAARLFAGCGCPAVVNIWEEQTCPWFCTWLHVQRR
jgi:hypothetical protein